VADAAAGALPTLLAPLLPTHLHVVGAPWTATNVARALAPTLLALLAWACWRARRRTWARLGLAALAAAVPVLAIAWTGGTPFHQGYSYVVLPVIAAAVGVGVAGAVLRGGALRLAAAAAGSLLIGASVAGTLSAAPAFRDRAAFVSAAARAAPDSVLVAAWRVGELARRVPAAGPDRGVALLAALPDAHRVAEGLTDVDGRPSPTAHALRRDGAAAVGTAAALSGFASALAETAPGELPPDAAMRLPDLERVAAAAAAVAPDWDASWLVLARVRARSGANLDALEAAQRASALVPDDPVRMELVARFALAVGLTDLAVERMAAAAELEELAAAREARDVRRENVLLHAEALAGDAAASGLLVQLGWAVEMLVPLYESGDRGADLRSLLYEIHLLWGDGLVSLDRTAPARVAYQRAVQIGGERSEAAEHLRWLEERLAEEMREAQAVLDRAAAGEGNVANALLDVAIVHCRAGNWDTADAILRRIEQGQGGMNAALRFTRAVHRYASREDLLPRAESELRLVLEEAPELHEARYRLAGVLLERGRVEEAAQEYRRAARDGAAYEWAIEALELARRLEMVLARTER
jgi:tetratricopeptide (TPR) repeat protein